MSSLFDDHQTVLVYSSNWMKSSGVAERDFNNPDSEKKIWTCQGRLILLSCVCVVHLPLASPFMDNPNSQSNENHTPVSHVVICPLNSKCALLKRILLGFPFLNKVGGLYCDSSGQGQSYLKQSRSAASVCRHIHDYEYGVRERNVLLALVIHKLLLHRTKWGTWHTKMECSLHTDVFHSPR